MLVVTVCLMFAVSVLLSGIGLGGGAFYVPLLVALGYPFHVASSTSLFLIMVTGFSAFSRFQRAGLVDWKLAVVMDTFTDLGAFVGGLTAFRFAPRVLKIAFAVLLILAAVAMSAARVRGPRKTVPRGFGVWHRRFAGQEYAVNLFVAIPATFAIGYASGALGVAGGLLKIPLMVLVFGVPQRVAAATSSLMVGLTGLFGFVGHGITGVVNWPLALSLGLVVVVGGQLGSRLSIAVSDRALKRWTTAAFVGIGLWMLVQAVLH
ncbi:MAG: sulfite exporter TauE/SafE family protein [Calditrichaeota bacterium]|nr:sulfite exporter TauE/SafE family protein [Calditrichota bacterium]